MLESIQVKDVVQRIKEWWGELRTVLSEPGVASWQHLCELLEQCPSREERALAIENYCVESLRRWPESIHRRPTSAWIDSLHSGEFDVGLTLINSLKVEGAMLGDAGIKMIFDAPSLDAFRSLDLRNNLITSRGFAHMLDADCFSNLYELHLENNCIEDRALEGFVHIETLELRVLDMRGNRISEEGARQLARAPALTNLKQLDLDPAPIGLDGMISIAESEHLDASLREIWSARLERLFPGYSHRQGG